MGLISHNIGFTPSRLRRSGPSGHALLWAGGANSDVATAVAPSKGFAGSSNAARVVNPRDVRRH